MYWLKKLKEFKKENNMTYKEISQKSKIPLTTVEKLFSGRTHDPKLTMIAGIVHAMGHTLGELIPDSNSTFRITDIEKDIISDIRNLDTLGKTRVNDTIKSESARIAAEKNASKPRFSRIHFDFPVSAGTGEFLDNRTAVIAELTDEPPHGTDYILRISGNSMEPQFFDGDYIYVKNTECVDYGEIGIFAAEGNVYMKEYTPDGLKSLNPEYSLIKFYDGIRCLGKVLGTVTGSIKIVR